MLFLCNLEQTSIHAKNFNGIVKEWHKRFSGPTEISVKTG
jgi:hypothetical protein